VPHPLAGLFHEALSQHFVVRVERAVEEDERRALEPVGKVLVHHRAARHVEERLSGSPRGYFQSDGVALPAAVVRIRRAAFEIQRDLAGHRERFDVETGLGDRRRLPERQLTARHDLGIENVENGVRLERAQDAG
jgi:hypothetical protein